MRNKFLRLLSTICALALFMYPLLFEVANASKVEKYSKFETNGDYVAGEIIVKYRPEQIDLRNNLGSLRAQVLNSSKSLKEKDRIQSQNASLLTIEDGQTVAEKIVELQSDPSVEYAEPNYRRSPMVISTNDPSRGLLWGLDNTGQTVNGTAGTADADIDIPEAWAINEGTNATVTVAVIDTGVDYNHPDLAGNMWDGSACKDEDGNALGGCLHGYDYYEGYEAGGDNDPMPGAETGFYHGTHVAGTIGAVKNNSTGLVGVAPNVKIMALKFGFETFSEVKAIDFARQNGAKVINASYGGTGYTSLEYNAINAFRTAGGIFVAAAGNNGDSYQPAGWNNDTESTHIYPSDYNLDNIISVAAVDQNDNLTTFSNYGATSVDVAAPGTNIYSTYPGNAYAYSNGTSMATPHVAGLVALVWGYRPDLEYSQVRSILLTSGDDKASLSGKTTTGKRINAQSSLVSEIGELHHINISPSATQNIVSGQTINFTAQGQDIDNNNIVGLSYTWTGTSASNSGLFNNLTPGAHQVRASSGGINSASVTVNVAVAPVWMPVYRFYNMKNGAHFYTANEAEKNNVIARYYRTYKFEGVVYQINTANTANSQPLYRLWNTTGSHFYTVNYTEAINATVRWPSKYKYEGPVYNVSLEPSTGLPVFRFYNMKNGTHFYTANEDEKNNVIARWPATYKYEGIAYYLGQ